MEQAHAKFIVYAAACEDATVRGLIDEAEQPFLRCAELSLRLSMVVAIACDAAV